MSRRAVAGTVSLPKITPLVLKRRAAAFDNPDWLFELKYDGFRALLEIDGADTRLGSRNRNRFRHMDTLAAALANRLRVSDAILDGEIICADHSGRPIFIEMLRGRHPFSFVAFDLLWLNGEDLRPLPLVERKVHLNRLLRRRSNHIIAEAIAVEGCGKALMAAVEQHDLEGIVAKRKSDPYRRGVYWKILHPDLAAHCSLAGRHLCRLLVRCGGLLLVCRGLSITCERTEHCDGSTENKSNAVHRYLR
jgi:bifunctional non-homologous end joining protein LigD